MLNYCMEIIFQKVHALRLRFFAFFGFQNEFELMIWNFQAIYATKLVEFW